MNVEQNTFLARVAEQAERFDDMVDFLAKVLSEKGAEVSSDERNLLSVAFKNLISSKRTACRTIQAVEQNPKYQKFKDALGSYKATIEKSLTEDCQRVVDIINSNILSKECDGQIKCFFVKMVGDYYRYMAENAKGSSLDHAKNKALESYQQAMQIELPACDPIKLGLALNFSVFYYEAHKNTKEAVALAGQALEDALDKIDELEEDEFRDAKGIIELLKENLTLWKEEEEGDNCIDDL